MALDGAASTTRGDIPEGHRLVDLAGGGGEDLAIGGKRQAPNGVRVVSASQGANQRACGGVPEFDRSITRAGGEALAVGAEGEVAQGTHRVILQSEGNSATGDGPDPNGRLAAAGRGQRLTVGADGDPSDMIDAVVVEGAHQCARA